MKISQDQLANAIQEQLLKYDKEVAEEVKKCVDDVSKEAKQIIDEHITFQDRTGKYRKSLEIKTVYEDEFVKKNVWHSKGKEYRLTHLLEKGHATRNGGRTKEFAHIKYGDDYVKEQLPKRITEVIKRHGK